VKSKKSPGNSKIPDFLIAFAVQTNLVCQIEKFIFGNGVKNTFHAVMRFGFFIFHSAFFHNAPGRFVFG